jgi:MFS family permease
MKVESANAVVSATSWVAIPAAPLGAWLAQRTNCPSGMIMTCLLLASVAISCVAHWGGSWAWFVAIGLLFGPPGGLIMTLPTEVVAPERGAVAMGVFFTCYYAGLGILPAVAGYLRDLSHSAASPLWFAVLLLLFATLSLIAFRVFQSRRRCIRAEG